MCINCFKSEYCASNQNVVLYPDLLAVGGGTHNMCAGVVRQDHTGAHLHALG